MSWCGGREGGGGAGLQGGEGAVPFAGIKTELRTKVVPSERRSAAANGAFLAWRGWRFPICQPTACNEISAAVAKRRWKS